MAEQPPSTRIDPGQHKTFIYVGDFIPNKVLVKNLGTTEARFRLTSAPATPPGWEYYEVAPGSALRSFTVHFPTAKLTVYNDGATPIEVAGDGIRPS